MTDGSEIVEIERRRRKAMVAADLEALSSMFADDMLWMHSSARVDTKSSLLSAIASGSTRYRSINCSQETIRCYGDVTLITGIADIQVELNKNLRSLQSRFTIVWANVKGKWQVVNWQSTSVANPV